MARATTVRCDDCSTEFELFKDLAKVSGCSYGRRHRAVRLRARLAPWRSAPAGPSLGEGG